MRDLPFSSGPLIRWPGFICAIAERASLPYWLALIGTVVFAVVFAWGVSP
jgi:hypothetical protein